MDRLGMLRTFVEVADRASFTEAARERRISPTAASRAIASLEQMLGVPLFRRTTRHVALTPEGAAYLEQCRHALAVLDDAAGTLRGEDASPRGLLVVTAPVVFGRMHVLPLVAELLRAHPALDVRLTLTDRVVRLVEEGVDVAVRIADLADSALHAVRVGAVHRVLVASPAYLAAHGTPASVEALGEHVLIAFDAFAQNGEWRFGAMGRPALRVEPRLLTNSVEAAIDAAVAGLGITRALSYQVSGHIAEGRLTAVLSAHDPPAVPVTLLFQVSRQRSPNLRAFVEAAGERLRPLLR